MHRCEYCNRWTDFGYLCTRCAAALTAAGNYFRGDS